MKKFFFLPTLFLFQITFSQAESPISFLHPECLDEIVSGVSRNEMHKYFAFYEIEKYYQTYFYVERYNETDSRKPKFYLKGLDFKESPVIGKWIDKMIYPGEYVRLQIEDPESKSKSKSNSYYIYATGDLVEKENKEFPFFERLDNYELRIVFNNTNNLIFSFDSLNAWDAGGFEGGVTLYWIGDLNGDKQIDIIIGATSDYRYNSYILLLSNDNPDEMFTQYNAGGCSSC